ncbi:Fic family protein [Deinococcus arcticus]|uniref:Fic family protein n=1 Tax=Deinococcus arcticus TaxID=2136176 RepID=UPI001304FABB|nr:Fic family protein [Deinococcus arcticus]
MLLHHQLFDAPPATLQVSDLQAWHAVLGAALGIRAGAWRTGDVTFGSYYGLPPSEIDAAVHATYAHANEHLDYLSYLPDAADRLEGVVMVSAYVHARLIRIHPFEDGNGRTARLVLTGQFLTAGFDPPNLSRLSRDVYLSALNRYNHLGTDDLYCPALDPLKKVILDLL